MTLAGARQRHQPCEDCIALPLVGVYADATEEVMSSSTNVPSCLCARKRYLGTDCCLGGDRAHPHAENIQKPSWSPWRRNLLYTTTIHEGRKPLKASTSASARTSCNATVPPIEEPMLAPASPAPAVRVPNLNPKVDAYEKCRSQPGGNLKKTNPRMNSRTTTRSSTSTPPPRSKDLIAYRRYWVH